MSEVLGDIHLGKDEITRESIIEMILILEKNIDDFRVLNRTTFNLYNLLIIMFLAVISGYANASAFEHYCKRNYNFLEKLGLLSNKTIPSHDTFRRVLMLLNPVFLEKALTFILNSFFDKVEKHLDDDGTFTIMSVDGKELRGTGRSKNTQNPLENIETLNVYNVSRGICLFSKTIDEKTNEIPIAQSLLVTMNLKKVLVTADALHTQTETAEIIVSRGGYYLLTVKDNQRLLREHIEFLFDNPKDKRLLTSLVNYNDKKERIFFFYKINPLEKDDDFKDKRYYVKYLNGVDAAPIYFITNLKDKNLIAEGVIKRWEIENDLHRNKDILLQEDYIRYINKNVAGNLVVINNFVLTFIKIFKDLFDIERVKYAKLDLANSYADILKTMKLISKKRIKFEFNRKK